MVQARSQLYLRSRDQSLRSLNELRDGGRRWTMHAKPVHLFSLLLTLIAMSSTIVGEALSSTRCFAVVSS